MSYLFNEDMRARGIEPWPVPERANRLAAAVIDVVTMFVISSPLVWLGSVTARREFTSDACSKTASNYAACIHSFHVSLYSAYSFYAAIAVALVGTFYFGLLQAAQGHRTLGERLRAVRLVSAEQRSPLVRPSVVHAGGRFLFGVVLVLPVYATAVMLWLEPKIGFLLLAVVVLAALVFRKGLRSALSPEAETGMLLWDRATKSIVVDVAAAQRAADAATAARGAEQGPPPSSSERGIVS